MTDLTMKIGGESTPSGVSDTPIVPAAPETSPFQPVAGPVYNGPIKSAGTTEVAQGGTTPSGLVIKSDGTIDYGASLDAVKAAALALQQKASTLASQNSTTVTGSTLADDQAKAANQGKPGYDALGNPISSVVSSSSPIIAGEQKITQDVNDLTATNDASTTAHQAYLDELSQESAALDARRTAEAAGINANFDQQQQKLQDAQKQESGTFTATLARIGGYLGDSASAQGAIINLNQQHAYQLSDLESKRQSALQDAKNAIDDKQFAVARLKASEAKDYAKEIADNKQQFFQNKIAILNEQRQQDDSQRAAIKDKLTNLAYLDPTKVSDATKTEIDKFYGTPGFTDSYLSVTKATNDAKSQKDQVDAKNAMVQFLQNIPQGQKVTFPDGTEYTGMGKAGDVSTFLQVDNAGNGHLITYNKVTGATNTQNMGTVGKTSGGGSGGTSIAKTDPVVVDNAVNLFLIGSPKDNVQGLETTKDKNGKYDPDVYINLRNQLKESNHPQLVQYMDKLFLNKNNDYFSEAGIKRLRSKGIYYGDTTLPPDTSATDSVGNDVQAGQ